MKQAPKIVACKIGPYPRRMFDPMPKVTVTFTGAEAAPKQEKPRRRKACRVVRSARKP